MMANIDAIKAEIKRRNITSLYHFTPLKNIMGILDIGLWSKQSLNESGLEFANTDEVRFDCRSNYISTSISFPNYKMFYSKVCEYPQQIWCVLELDPSILYKQECLFFPNNAACSGMSSKSAAEISSYEGFSRMFDGHHSTSKYAHDVQAEVMVKEFIDIDFIKSINVKHISDEALVKAAVEPLGKKFKDIKLLHNQNLFYQRSDSCNNLRNKIGA